MKRVDVAALGHGLVDVRLRVDRYPGPDEEASIQEEERGAGGSAVNVAIDVAILGGRSAALVKIGFDQFGRIVYDELFRHGVLLEGVRISPTLRTGFSIVAIDSEGNTAIYGYKGAAEALEPGELDREVIAASRILHVASLRLDTSTRAARIARRAGALVSWDPGRRLARAGLESARDMLEETDIVLVNRLEARLLTGESDPVAAARRIAEAGPRIVVVKLGPEGALMIADGSMVRMPAYPVERVVDTTGAGDAFAAGFLLALARGHTPVEALRSGLYVAARKIERLGSHSLPRGIKIPPEN